MSVPDPSLDAEIAALLRAIRKADDACFDADHLGPDDDPDLEIFFAAVRRLHQLETELTALMCKAAGGRPVHAGTRSRH